MSASIRLAIVTIAKRAMSAGAVAPSRVTGHSAASSAKPPAIHASTSG